MFVSFFFSNHNRKYPFLSPFFFSLQFVTGNDTRQIDIEDLTLGDDENNQVSDPPSMLVMSPPEVESVAKDSDSDVVESSGGKRKRTSKVGGNFTRIKEFKQKNVVGPMVSFFK